MTTFIPVGTTMVLLSIFAFVSCVVFAAGLKKINR